MITLTTVSSAADLARPLLAGARAIIVVPPDAAVAELAIAAAKCLSCADYAKLASGDARLRSRVEWLLGRDASTRFPAASLGPLSPLEFAVLKERAARIVIVESLDAVPAACLPERPRVVFSATG
jgi:hypothetical protein